MKEVYLTEEGKKELEAKIAELEKEIKQLDSLKRNERNKSWDKAYVIYLNDQKLYREILSSATILPVEDGWKNGLKYGFINGDIDATVINMQSDFPNGIIIQPKE